MTCLWKLHVGKVRLGFLAHDLEQPGFVSEPSTWRFSGGQKTCLRLRLQVVLQIAGLDRKLVNKHRISKPDSRVGWPWRLRPLPPQTQ
jgi:hypothetical protein